MNRLGTHGIAATKFTRFGRDRVGFTHPCGIPHELVENPGDNRSPITKPGISAEHGIKGIYGAVVAVMDCAAIDDFLTIALPLKKVADDHEGLAFEVPNAGGRPRWSRSCMIRAPHRGHGPSSVGPSSNGR